MVFEQFATYVVDTIGLTGAPRAAAHFFVYDTLKILAILTAVIFGVTYLRTYFPPEKIREYLDGKTAFTGYALAALMGIVSPFCSCSTIPIFLGMVGAGIPFGITITFLAVSPMINEAALVVLPGVVGLELTALYAVSGITIGMTSGYTLNRLGFDRYVDEFEFGDSGVDIDEPTRRERLESAEPVAEGESGRHCGHGERSREGNAMDLAEPDHEEGGPPDGDGAGHPEAVGPDRPDVFSPAHERHLLGAREQAAHEASQTPRTEDDDVHARWSVLLPVIDVFLGGTTGRALFGHFKWLSPVLPVCIDDLYNLGYDFTRLFNDYFIANPDILAVNFILVV